MQKGKHPAPGRPTVENKRKPRSFKTTDEEWQAIQERAKKEGVSTAEYIRRKALGAG